MARIAVSGWLIGSTPTRLTMPVTVPSASASTQAARCSNPRWGRPGSSTHPEAAPEHSGSEGVVSDGGCSINNAGGCGASLKEVGHLLRDDPQAAAQADAFSKRVQDISEFLAANLHVAPRGPINARVVYADSCHLRHAQRVVHQPRELLRRIPGVELVELSRPDLCCGSAGTYNILHAETAQQILDLKLDDIRAARPDLLVTTNTGCHMQYLHGVKQAGLKLPVLHLVELLDRAYECE